MVLYNAINVLKKNRRTIKNLVIIIVIYKIVGAFYGLAQPNPAIDYTKYSFGIKTRVYIQELEQEGYPRLCLWDSRPEDQAIKKFSENSRRILDYNVYAYEGHDGLFFTYKEDVLYVYGSTGFFIIFADPFKIKLLQTNSLTTPRGQEVAYDLEVYSSDQLERITLVDLSKREKEAYVRLQEKAKDRIEKLKAANMYPEPLTEPPDGRLQIIDGKLDLIKFHP